MRTQRIGLFFPALLLAIGVAGGGWFIGHGLLEARSADRYVTVKGISERPVEADLALWTLKFTVTADELDAAREALTAQHDVILAFLERQGIPPESAEVAKVEVNDLMADPYRQGEIRQRFIVSQTLMVRSDEPAVIEAASQEVAELLEAGVVLAQQWGPEGGPSYLFGGLTAIKPAMIAEATANARNAAQQFATDSGAVVGAIRTANPGVVPILPRDPAPNATEAAQRLKTVRVVVTIEYFLADE